MRTKFILTTIAIAMVVLFAGCKKDTYQELDSVCPLVVSTSPANGEINVPLVKTITATFNEKMDPKTITAASVMVQSGGNLSGTVSFLGQTASFVPSAPLVNNTTYIGKITTSVKDLFGNALQTNYTWSFSTGTLVTPIVISTDPQNLQTAVVLNKVVTATFNVNMDPSAFAGSTFTLRMGGNLVPGTVTVLDTVAYFRPTSNLMPDSTYTATITTAAKSLAGTFLASDYVWSFSTGASVAPYVISNVPLDNATGVPQAQVLTATFSEAMNPSTINATTFMLRQGSTSISGAITYAGSTATFTPTTPLLSNTLYTATVTMGAQNPAGLGLANNHLWSFTTIVLPGPTVVSTVPINNALNVPVNQVVMATFSEAMDPLTLNGTTFTLKQGSNVVLGTVTKTSTTASFTPTANLLSGAVYTATISTGAQNLAGLPLANDYVWTFTAVVLPSPTVISTIPLNNATAVPLNQVVMATFSEGMDPLTLNGATFTLKQGANIVAGTVTKTSTTASFTPTLNLSSGAIYTATITTGAKNVGGIPMASNYVWNFTALVIPPPTVISTDPINLATNVPLNKVVSATFSVPMNPATINGSTFTLKRGNNVVGGMVTYNGSTAYFTPTNLLRSDTVYTATITTGAQNPAGISLVSNYVWTFNTVPHLGPPPVDLNGAMRFGILAGVGVSNMAGFSEIRNLDVGIYPGVRSSVVGFPPAIVVNGAIYASDDIAPPGVPAMLLQAKNDLTAAYLFAEGASNPAPATVAGDLGGLTLAPGIYKSTSTLLIQSGDLTLDAQGDVNATWIFQIASGFTTVGGAGGNVILIGGAKASNVTWQTGSSATIGDYTAFNGNILALTSITMNAYAVANGRMLARNAAVVMTSTNIINKP